MFRHKRFGVLVVGMLLALCIGVVAMAEEAPISLGKSYIYNVKEPSSQYPDPQNKKLTDGVISPENVYWDPNWVGVWDIQPWVITIDLGQTMPIRKVRTHHLAGTAGIVYPTKITVSVSANSATWSEPIELEIADIRPAEGESKWFTLDHLNLEGRWVMVSFVPPSSGANMFVGEIEVY